MTTPTNDKDWWLLTTKVRKEQYAREQLDNQGYITYLPLTQRSRKNRGKMKITTEPLFPRYVFIQLNQTTDNWGSVRSTYGISDFVRFGMKYARVPSEIIAHLKYNEAYLSDHAFALDRHKNGDIITIEQEGSFKGLNGIFQHYDSDQRCSVLIEILHQTSRLKLPISDVVTYDGPPQ
ncbi:MAG: transcription/translation regulatory transformer protein RfaH [Thiotrichaceae bacterium]|nr:transcription/translation regulatory transformer protein RfaH [Thiotrichaceae bacterium]